MTKIEEYRGCLKHLAFQDQATIGRQKNRGTVPIIEKILEKSDPYLADQIKIAGSKAFRRLPNKTQVFVDPSSTYVRDRASHTKEVESAAMMIASMTGLNRDLCRAASLGHDLGHPPFGHMGEDILSEEAGRKFEHEKVGVAIAQYIERKGQGLNLSYETLLGIYFHSGSPELPPGVNLPLECKVVRLADGISYLFADANDIVRLEFPKHEIVNEKANFFGVDHRWRVQNCIAALIQESAEESTLSFTKSETARAFRDFHDWMYREVYKHCDDIRGNLCSALRDVKKSIESAPYFAELDPIMLLGLMTDNEVLDWVKITRNRPFPKMEEIAHLGITEIAPYIKGVTFDHIDLDPNHFE